MTLPRWADITAATRIRHLPYSAYHEEVPHHEAARRWAGMVLLLALTACSTTVAGQAHRRAAIPPASVISTPVPPSSTQALPPTAQPSTSTLPPSAAVSATAGPTPIAGAAGIGDSYYPLAGNGGYDVIHYDVSFRYDPADGAFSATTIVTLQATDTPLATFNFDLQPTMTVSRVHVGAESAGFYHHDAELIIAPSTPLQPWQPVDVTVLYAGIPDVIPDGTSNLGDGGWYRTASGGAVVIGEPFSASAWYPSNDHPGDPATFTVMATVPAGWDVISIGEEITADLPAADGGMTVTRFSHNQPVPTYVTTVMIDKLTIEYDDQAAVPIINAFTENSLQQRELASRTGAVLDVLVELFGPYPFDSYGGIYTGEGITFSLETAGRPVYAQWVDVDTIIHETAHQWFGNSVMLRSWADVCLNECFASYAPWLYDEKTAGADLDARWQAEMQAVGADNGFWEIPLVDPGAGNEFTAVYSRGPLALHALRHAMGDRAFMRLLQLWPAEYRGANPTFQDFAAMAQQLAGHDISEVLTAWFVKAGVPAPEVRYPGALG